MLLKDEAIPSINRGDEFAERAMLFAKGDRQASKQLRCAYCPPATAIPTVNGLSPSTSLDYFHNPTVTLGDFRVSCSRRFYGSRLLVSPFASIGYARLFSLAPLPLSPREHAIGVMKRRQIAKIQILRELVRRGDSESGTGFARPTLGGCSTVARGLGPVLAGHYLTTTEGNRGPPETATVPPAESCSLAPSLALDLESWPFPATWISHPSDAGLMYQYLIVSVPRRDGKARITRVERVSSSTPQFFPFLPRG